MALILMCESFASENSTIADKERDILSAIGPKVRTVQDRDDNFKNFSPLAAVNGDGAHNAIGVVQKRCLTRKHLYRNSTCKNVTRAQLPFSAERPLTSSRYITVIINSLK